MRMEEAAAPQVVVTVLPSEEEEVPSEPFPHSETSAREPTLNNSLSAG